ncbi:MAG TPA: acetate kinase, partial [Dehalococcoidia bacterium]
MKVLAVNCGSSSLKLRLVETDGLRTTTLAFGAVENIGANAAITFRANNDAVVRESGPIADWSAAFGALFER